jgi:hypothetical protein
MIGSAAQRTTSTLASSCLQRFKTEPLYRRKSEPPWVGSFLSPFLRL